MTRVLLVVVPLLGACVSMKQVRADLAESERLVAQARGQLADLCAGAPYAEAQAQLGFAELELAQGDGWRASQHAAVARAQAEAALRISGPCGKADRDADGVVDVIDRCPDQAEDVDGDADEDGCRDFDPYADADGDGVRNIDDECIEEREDLDRDNDEDGCPETSENRDGDNVVDVVDACPDRAEDVDGFEDSDGCPEDDNDKDGVPDGRDRCPVTPEDLDGWVDADGCPEDDNDGDGVRDFLDACPDSPGVADARGCPANDRDRDGVADEADACPDEAETPNRWLDRDGCADVASPFVRLGAERVELVKPIAFVGVSADLDPEARAILDDVAKALVEVGTGRVRIEGHTDGSGDETANLVLSRRRAEVVLDALVARGVAVERLEVVGLGGTRPIDTNRTEAGRTANRRIELWFVKP